MTLRVRAAAYGDGPRVLGVRVRDACLETTHELRDVRRRRRVRRGEGHARQRRHGRTQRRARNTDRRNDAADRRRHDERTGDSDAGDGERSVYGRRNGARLCDRRRRRRADDDARGARPGCVDVRAAPCATTRVSLSGQPRARRRKRRARRTRRPARRDARLRRRDDDGPTTPTRTHADATALWTSARDDDEHDDGTSDATRTTPDGRDSRRATYTRGVGGHERDVHRERVRRGRTVATRDCRERGDLRRLRATDGHANGSNCYKTVVRLTGRLPTTTKDTAKRKHDVTALNAGRYAYCTDGSGRDDGRETTERAQRARVTRTRTKLRTARDGVGSAGNGADGRRDSVKGTEALGRPSVTTVDGTVGRDAT
ncbi:hypothetical protein JTE90_012058 [Oedothorax gibbosus]|uniref:Uncharacterized protein n=1 Tax=Oedothorax gibbosus TaxID=931172 RepID=A0AAV6TEI9_9ARAC|nr:hypothetical protein JTE90_012058 [Oedothorax gibbosus]